MRQLVQQTVVFQQILVDSRSSGDLVGQAMEEEDEYGNTVSKIKLTADHIQLEDW